MPTPEGVDVRRKTGSSLLQRRLRGRSVAFARRRALRACPAPFGCTLGRLVPPRSSCESPGQRGRCGRETGKSYYFQTPASATGAPPLFRVSEEARELCASAAANAIPPGALTDAGLTRFGPLRNPALHRVSLPFLVLVDFCGCCAAFHSLSAGNIGCVLTKNGWSLLCVRNKIESTARMPV